MEEKHSSVISENIDKGMRISPRQQQSMTEKGSVNVSTVNNFSLANFKNQQANPMRSEHDTCTSEMKIHEKFEPKNTAIQQQMGGGRGSFNQGSNKLNSIYSLQ
jgi:hypothetical protein